MRAPNNGNHARNQSERLLKYIAGLWETATRATSVDIDDARREYITRVTYLISGILACMFSLVFFIGWSLDYMPGDSVLIILIYSSVLWGGWFFSVRGHWRMVAIIPPFLIFLMAVYGNLIGGEGAPALVLYVLSIIMAALLVGDRAAWAAAVLCIAAYAVTGAAYLHGYIQPLRTMETAFVNRIIIVTATYVSITALLWFLGHRYRLALAEADKTASLLSEHAVMLGETNLMLEVENAERRKAAEALQESEERFRSLFEYSRDAIIIMEPPSWRCARVNRTALDMFRADADGLTALGPWDLTPPLQPDGESSEARIKGMIDRAVAEGWCFFEWQCRRLDGSEFSATALLSRIEQSGLTFLQATVRDITERRRNEDQIKASLKEKEVLLREIHHRVKNNFQIITSLLNLQSRNITDPELLKLFEDSTTRIRAMALVHEKLYQSSDLSEIDFSSYLKTIAEDLSSSYSGIIHRPRLIIDAEEASLGIDQAVPCGLIANELITNALKYAFTDGAADNRLSITLRKDKGGMVSIRISDNGAGLPAGIDTDSIQTLGLQLVGLLTKQIHGTISLDREGGTAWTISFPLHPFHQQGNKI